MKKLLFISTIATAFILSSCSTDDGPSGSGLVDELDADSEAALESSLEDVDLITEAGMETLEEDVAGATQRDIILDCATVTKDTVNMVVTVDYGDGCEGPGGRIRKGIIRIEYNLRKLVPGAFRIVTFEDFSIDDVQVEGIRTVENISVSLEDNPTFESTLEDGQLTFTDGTIATREANHVRTWFRSANPLLDEATVTGGANGTRRDGVSYTVEILEELVYKRDCRSRGVYIPVAGVKQITTDANVFVIDYGDGECDREVTITINGEVFTRTLNPFRFR